VKKIKKTFLMREFNSLHF